jgi:hypothetical protein
VLTDGERRDLADRLMDAWGELRSLPLGGRGHLADILLEAADAIRPAVSTPLRGEQENCEWCEGDRDLCDGNECQK